jgi:hypothetical protein
MNIALVFPLDTVIRELGAEAFGHKAATKPVLVGFNGNGQDIIDLT